MTMGVDELWAFLDRRPGLLGVVGTLRRDGSPSVVPVWYRWDGEAVRIWTDERRGWVRNLAREPRAAFSVQEQEPPFAAVLLRGMIATAQSEEAAAEIRRITGRYIPEGEVEEYVAGWPDLWTIVTIRPASITSWEKGY